MPAVALAATVCVLSSMAVAPVGGGTVPRAPAPGVAPVLTRATSDGPPGTVGSIQVTVHNPAATPTGVYDQPVGVNSSHFSNLINANWTNAVLEYTANGTPVDAWIESGNSNTSTNTLLWLRLASLPADGWTNVSIYLGPKSWFNLSASSYLGEAPTLSATYGEFDNGAQVFNEYADFAGTTLPAGWTTLGNWAGTVRNGLSLNSSYDLAALEAPFATSLSSDVVVDTSATMAPPGEAAYVFVAAAPGLNGHEFFPSAYALEAGVSGSSTVGIVTSNSTGPATAREASVTAPVTFSEGAHVLGLGWRASNSTEWATVNYDPVLSQVDANNTPISDFGLGTYCSSNCSAWNVTWVRARAAPDPMPVVTGTEVFSPFGVVATGVPLATDTGHTVAFNCNASAEALTYDWNFGDGASVAGRTAVHTYARPGAYDAVCTVTDVDGATGSAAAPVRINALPAILLFQAAPSNFPLGASLNLVANISGGTPPFTYSYVGLPPGCANRDTAALSCLPGETGAFAIEIVVKDAASEATEAWITVTVTPATGSGGGSSLSPAEGYALAGGVAGLVVLAGVLPVLLWSRRPPAPPPDPVRSEHGSNGRPRNGTPPPA